MAHTQSALARDRIATVTHTHIHTYARVRMRKQLHKCADELDIQLGNGVYIACIGPSFETPAEIRAFGFVARCRVG